MVNSVQRRGNAGLTVADNAGMPMTFFITFLAFAVGTLYIMRRRVRQGRRKATF